jgi:imidazolonepropionase-like amidohydrolase
MNRTVLAGGAVLDPVAGDVRDADVAVDGGLVAEIGPEAARHGLPAMAHAHGARAAESAAAAGVRSVEHGFFLDEEAPAWRSRAQEASARSSAMAMDAGIHIAMGTHCPVAPHARRLEELAVMHRRGMDAAGVWRACTSDAWSFDDLGSRVRRVWKDGVEVR